MTKYQFRCHEMFVRVRGFGQSHEHLFPPGSPGAEAIAVVSGVDVELSALLVKEIQAVDHPKWRARARVALTRLLQRVARAGRQIARLDRRKDHPFVVPSPRTDTVLLTTARQFLRDADPLEARFIAIGMPAAFLADLRETTDNFAQSVKRQRDARGESVAVRAGYRDAFRRGFDAVLTLDIVMANTHQHDEVARAAWTSARRVEKSAPKRRKRIVA